MTSGYFYTITEKTNIKVFGKGSGEEPFLRKVCPDKLLIKLL